MGIIFNRIPRNPIYYVHYPVIHVKLSSCKSVSVSCNFCKYSKNSENHIFSATLQNNSTIRSFIIPLRNLFLSVLYFQCHQWKLSSRRILILTTFFCFRDNIIENNFVVIPLLDCLVFVQNDLFLCFSSK